MEDLPNNIPIVFWITTLSTLVLFHWAASNMKQDRYKSNLVLMGLTGWLIIQAILAKEGIYYSYMDSVPPIIAMGGVIPMLLLILSLFVTKSGKAFIDQLPVRPLIFLHTIRIPVEIVLYWLMLEKTIPVEMTFEGRNFDIIAGITAPIVGFAFAGNPMKNRAVLIIWNIVCLALLINIVSTAVLAVATPIQQLAFDQPNQAVLYFPYVWLPVFIVPVVLFSHLVVLRKLLFRIS